MIRRFISLEATLEFVQKTINDKLVVTVFFDTPSMTWKVVVGERNDD